MWFLKRWKRKPRAQAAPLAQMPGRDRPAEAFMLACGVDTVIEDHLAPGTADPAVRKTLAPVPSHTRRAA